MWFIAVLPTRIDSVFVPGRTSALMSSRYGGHHTEPARWPLTVTTAASRIGASSQVRIPGPLSAGSSAFPDPKSSVTVAPRAGATSSNGRLVGGDAREEARVVVGVPRRQRVARARLGDAVRKRDGPRPAHRDLRRARRSARPVVVIRGAGPRATTSTIDPYASRSSGSVIVSRSAATTSAARVAPVSGSHHSARPTVAHGQARRARRVRGVGEEIDVRIADAPVMLADVG